MFSSAIQTNRGGIIKATGKSLPSHPSYGHICKRINKLNIKIKEDVTDEDIVIAVDSTGIKVTNRGQWMYDKWGLGKKKKGYLKIHIVVNIKTNKEILALDVTPMRKFMTVKDVKEIG
jgi:hypothetical protein